jgi:hypothetical protein
MKPIEAVILLWCVAFTIAMWELLSHLIRFVR